MNRREEALRRANEIVAKAESDYRKTLERTKRTNDGFIYFIGADDRRLVKIGWTGGDPRRRLFNLQTANAGELELLVAVAGTKSEEHRLHGDFSMDIAREGCRSEWFIASERVDMLLWCLRVGGMYPPKKGLMRLEAATRKRYEWFLGRQTYDEALTEACHRAIAVLK